VKRLVRNEEPLDRVLHSAFFSPLRSVSGPTPLALVTPRSSAPSLAVSRKRKLSFSQAHQLEKNDDGRLTDEAVDHDGLSQRRRVLVNEVRPPRKKRRLVIASPPEPQ